VGDLDGDGLGDLVIVDRDLAHPSIVPDERDGTGASAGKGAVYIFYGRTNWEAEERLDTVRLLLDRSGGGSGIGVAAAGDVDGDGRPDFVVSRKGEGKTTPDSLYVVFGGTTRYPTSSSIAEHALVLDGNLCDHTSTPAGVGDLDGDGYHDVAVPCLDDGDGHGYRIMYGGPELAVGQSTLAATVAAQVVHPAAEHSIYPAAAGDFDGDGYADIASGSVHLLRGGPVRFSGTTTIDESIRIVEGGEVSARFGPSIGDVDGDGRSDLLVQEQGALHLFGGQQTPLVRELADADAVISSSSDVNVLRHAGGEGVTLSGGPYLAVGQANLAPHGAVFVVPIRDLAVEGTLDEHLIYEGTAPPIGTADGAGASVALGDLDGDGLSDLAFGAPSNVVAGKQSVGRIYFVRSSQLLDDL
jgi:hypothetical protein